MEKKAFCFNICMYETLKKGNEITKKIKCYDPEELSRIFEDYVRDFGMKKIVINRSNFPLKIKDEKTGKVKSYGKVYKNSYFLLRYFIRFNLQKKITEYVDENHKLINDKRMKKGLKKLDFSIKFPKTKFKINKKISREKRTAVMIFCKNNLDKMSFKMRQAFYEEYGDELDKYAFKENDDEEGEIKKLLIMLISSNYPLISDSDN